MFRFIIKKILSPILFDEDQIIQRELIIGFWSSNFILIFFFLAILPKYFPDARLSPQIRSGPVVLMKSIIFSGNSIFFLDFSYLLSIFFFLMMFLLALLLLLLFSDSLRKYSNLDSSATSFIEVCCRDLNHNKFTANWFKSN